MEADAGREGSKVRLYIILWKFFGGCYYVLYFRVFHLEYDVVKDEYTRVSNNGETIKEWKKGVSECEDVQRKVEMDWGQIYLARKGKK